MTQMWTLQFLDNESSSVILQVCFLPSARTLGWVDGDTHTHTLQKLFFLTLKCVPEISKLEELNETSTSLYPWPPQPFPLMGLGGGGGWGSKFPLGFLDSNSLTVPFRNKFSFKHETFKTDFWIFTACFSYPQQNHMLPVVLWLECIKTEASPDQRTLAHRSFPMLWVLMIWPLTCILQKLGNWRGIRSDSYLWVYTLRTSPPNEAVLFGGGMGQLVVQVGQVLLSRHF